jgi:hypothetical protein
MQRKLWLWICAVALLAGCGSDSPDVSAEASRYDGLAHDIAAETTTYCNGRSWSATPEACAAALAAHEAAIGRHLDEMATLAPHLDQQQQRAGHMMHADGACRLRAMHAEMVRHRVDACSGATATLEAEEARHCDAMMSSAARMHDRAGEMMQRPHEWQWPSSASDPSPECAQGTQLP